MVFNPSGVVLDHSPATLRDWRAAMSVAAERPNMVVKASGLCIEGAGWVPEVNRELILDMLRIFGHERLMFGSNFPVDRMLIGVVDAVTKGGCRPLS